MSLFLIVPRKAPGKTVHLDRGNTSNGTKIQLWDRLPRRHKHFENQLWIWNGTLFVCYSNPIKCLHIAGGNTKNGTKIHLWDILSKRHPDRLHQEWRRQGENIVSRDNLSACWHLDMGHTGNGTKIQLWNVKNHENSRWRLVRVHPLVNLLKRLKFRRNNLYVIAPLKAPGKTVQLVRGRTSNGTKIQLWDRLPLGHKDYDNQLWLWDSTIIRSAKDINKCLHLDGGRTGNGTKIQLWDVLKRRHHDFRNQQWRRQGKNIVSMKNASACWHLQYGNTGNRTKIQLWDKKNHANGAWKVDKVFGARM